MTTKHVWPVSDDDKPILDEIAKQTDRGAALIAVAYLEERLVSAIKARMNRHEEIEGRLFRGAGPLASLSSKIDLGFLIGIYDLRVHKMLHWAREIRNEFAHQPEPRDFNSQRIFGLCGNVNFHVEIEMQQKETGLELAFQFVPDGTAKTAFLNAIRYLMLVLELELKQMPPRRPANPALPSLPGPLKPMPLPRPAK